MGNANQIKIIKNRNIAPLFLLLLLLLLLQLILILLLLLLLYFLILDIDSIDRQTKDKIDLESLQRLYGVGERYIRRGHGVASEQRTDG